jgi:hypothetical protein
LRLSYAHRPLAGRGRRCSTHSCPGIGQTA